MPLARANLLPQVGLSASVSRVMGSREFGNSLNQSVRVPLDYESPQVSLNLRTPCLLYTSDAADERSRDDLGGRRTFKKKKTKQCT